MAAETFVGWAKRVTKSGEYNLTKLIAFMVEAEAYWARQGKDWHVAGFRKCAGRQRGKGLRPRTMKHPESGALYVFPIFSFDRQRGEHIQATLLDALCPKCGATMERRSREDGADFLGCTGYPTCKGAAPHIWDDVVGSGEPERFEAPKPAPDVAALVRQVVVMVERARRCTEDRGMSLPIGYRTTAHLARLAVVVGDADEAWRLWVDGRVSKAERDMFDASALPTGTFAARRREDGNPSWYTVVAQVLDAGLHVMLVGPAGTGKTRFAKWFASRTDRELEMVVGTGDMSGQQLWVDCREASGGNVTTKRGPAARACTDGSVLLLDEVDGFDSNSLLPLNAVLNSDEHLSVPVIGRLEVNPEVRIIACANTNGRTRDRVYNARNRLDGAFLNRFAVVINTRFERAVDDKVALESIMTAMGE